MFRVNEQNFFLLNIKKGIIKTSGTVKGACNTELEIVEHNVEKTRMPIIKNNILLIFCFILSE